MAGLSATLCLKGGTKLHCLAGHIPHHATIPEPQHILTQWGIMWATKLVIRMDANEVFAQPFSTSARSFTGRGECILQWLGDNNLTLPLQDIGSPTHFPYNTALRPRRLDYIASRHNTTQHGGVADCRHRASPTTTGSNSQLNSRQRGDEERGHDLGAPQTQEPGGCGNSTCYNHLPWRKTHTIASHWPPKTITRPGRTTNKYSESAHLKQLRRSPGGTPNKRGSKSKRPKKPKRNNGSARKPKKHRSSAGGFSQRQQHKQRKQGGNSLSSTPGRSARRSRKGDAANPQRSRKFVQAHPVETFHTGGGEYCSGAMTQKQKLRPRW